MNVEKAMQTFVRSLPNFLTSKFSGTVVEDLFIKLQSSKLIKRIRWQTTSLHESRFETPVGTISFDVPPDAGYATQRQYEPKAVAAFVQELDVDSVVYDVGSRHGLYIELAKHFGIKPNQIHGFEADWFRYMVCNHNHASSGVVINHGYIGNGENDSITLDEYSELNSPPDVVKIDVEGAEKCVLSGSIDIVDRYKPTFFVELHPHKYHDSKKPSVVL